MIDGNLGAIFQKKLPLVHWQRIETGGTGRGIPDLNGCYAGVEVWIENKKVSGHKVHTMDPQQVAWLERRVRYGGRAFVAARKVETNEFWLLPASSARLLLDKQRVMDVPFLYYGHDWRQIASILFGPV